MAQQAASSSPPGRSLGIKSVPNLRDLGGYKTRDGFVVRHGIAYRSDQLNPISPDDMGKIAALRLKNDFDLRTAAERSERPDELPPEVNQVWLNVLADVKGTSAAELQSLIAKPREANEVLGGGKAEALFIEVYKEFITSRAPTRLIVSCLSNLAIPLPCPLSSTARRVKTAPVGPPPPC